MSAEPVVFLDEPEVGRRIRFTDGTHERLSEVVVSVSRDAELPGTILVETEDGKAYAGFHDPDVDANSQTLVDETGRLYVSEEPADVDRDVSTLPHGVLYGYNLGAFLLAPIWGLAHGVWSGLLALIPVLTPFVAGVFLARGNLWAWESGKYRDYESFATAQRRWAIAGVLAAAILLILVLVDRSRPYQQGW